MDICSLQRACSCARDCHVLENPDWVSRIGEDICDGIAFILFISSGTCPVLRAKVASYFCHCAKWDVQLPLSVGLSLQMCPSTVILVSENLLNTVQLVTQTRKRKCFLPFLGNVSLNDKTLTECKSCRVGPSLCTSDFSLKGRLKLLVALNWYAWLTQQTKQQTFKELKDLMSWCSEHHCEFSCTQAE